MKHHHSGCDCGHDHGTPHHSSSAAKRTPKRWERILGPLAPVVACAFCPACLGTYAKIFAALGVGICIGETEHRILLALAVTLSMVLGVRRARTIGRRLPLAVTTAGCVGLVAGHLADVSLLEWAGVALLLGAGLLERRWERAAVPSTR